METTAENIGATLRAEREARKISKQTVIEKTRLTYGQIIALEKGNKNVTVSTLLKYCDAIGLSLWLVRSGASISETEPLKPGGQ